MSQGYHVRALSRGLAVLDLLGAAPAPVTLMTVHERIGLPKSTLVRLLAALTEAAFVVRVDDRPAYRLGHRVMTLANAYVSSVDVSALAGRYLAVLSERTSQTASLGVLDGTDVVHAADRPLRYAIAKRGHATECGEHSAGLSAVAVPIRLGDRTVAAVSVAVRAVSSAPPPSAATSRT